MSTTTTQITTTASAAMAPISSIFHRTFNKQYPPASGGSGVYIIKQDGSKVLDGSSGAAVSCLGHGNTEVIEAIVDQARQMAFAHSSFFTSDPAEKLAAMLIDSSEGAFGKCMFLSSGSEAIESAIKIARQFHIANNQPQRVNFIARKESYHGNTFGSLSAGHNASRRAAFEPMLCPGFHHVSPCFYSRDHLEDESEEAYSTRLVAEVSDLIASLGGDTVAAIMLETVGGATLGAVPALPSYLKGLRSLCDKHGILLLFDEVMCGMGRVGTLHAWQSLGGVKPDLQTIGKGLGAGYQPISAVLASSRIHDVIEKGSKENPFVSGHTYQGHSIGCAAALATQWIVQRDGLLGNVQRMGEALVKKLRASTPMLKEVRGVGLFRAVEFDTQQGEAIAAEVAAACLRNGAAVYLCSPATDSILFAPPFIIDEEEVDELVGVFVRSVVEVLEKRGRNS